jgi:hypothetical protein
VAYLLDGVKINGLIMVSNILIQSIINEAIGFPNILYCKPIKGRSVEE